MLAAILMAATKINQKSLITNFNLSCMKSLLYKFIRLFISTHIFFDEIDPDNQCHSKAQGKKLGILVHCD
jgi:hypothetical protein